MRRQARHRAVLTAVAAVPLILLAVACGDDSDSGSSASDPDDVASAIDGRTYLSTESVGHTIVDGSRIRIEFADGVLHVNAGCNQMTTTYRVEDDVLSVDSFAATEMACEQALMDQDTWIIRFLQGSPTLAATGDTLVITGAESEALTLLDRVVADPDRPLEGTEWIVESIVTADAVESVPAGATAALTITDGSAAIEAGCNMGTAEVEVEEETLTFGPAALTAKECEPEVMALEEHVIAVVQGEVTYSITADRLTLRSGDIGLDLRANP
jgi:heat shock protein HslJ